MSLSSTAGPFYSIRLSTDPLSQKEIMRSLCQSTINKTIDDDEMGANEYLCPREKATSNRDAATYCTGEA